MARVYGRFTMRTVTGRDRLTVSWGMRVLHVSAEVAPFSKTGGLGDVAAALPVALARLGLEVMVVTPWYRDLGGGVAPFWIGDVEVPSAGTVERVGVGTLEQGGVRYVFVGHGDFGRTSLYGYADDVARFVRFSRAVPAVAARVGFVPDLVHAHDWHAALLPALLEHAAGLPLGFAGLPSVLTIHNIQFQGAGELGEVLRLAVLPTGLERSYLHHDGGANLLKSGIGFADLVTTVSPTYARELTEGAHAFGLDEILRHVGPKLVGILNGIDTSVWDPGSDPFIAQPYDLAAPAGKAACRQALQDELGLVGTGPLLGVVSRFADQKGIDLLLAAVPALLEMGWQLVLLGTGDAGLEAAAAAAARAEPGRVAARLVHDEALAHRVYAGCDALAVPSRFEPCGLSQMIAQRYGTLPIARATGGLADTIRHARDGFLFGPAEVVALQEACATAASAFATPAWETMRREAMALDRDWQTSAQEYLARYRGIMGVTT
jgi:starch synthase